MQVLAVHLASMEFTLHAARHPEPAEALAEHEERLVGGLAALRAGHGARPDAQQLPRRVVPRILDALAEPLGETGLTEGS